MEGFDLPSGVAANDEIVLVTNAGNNTVSVVDPDMLAITSVIKNGIGKRPMDVSIVQETEATARGHQGARYAVVANAGSDNISIVDLEKGLGIKKLKVQDEPTNIFATVRWAAVKNSGSDSVSIISLDRSIPGRRASSLGGQRPPVPKVQSIDTPQQTAGFDAVGWPTQANDAVLFIYTDNIPPFPPDAQNGARARPHYQGSVTV